MMARLPDLGRFFKRPVALGACCSRMLRAKHIVEGLELNVLPNRVKTRLVVIRNQLLVFIKFKSKFISPIQVILVNERD